MKKAVFTLLLACVAMLAFAQTAVIKDLTGTVELKLSGSSDFIPAGVGVEVAQDTIISTGFKSTALVQAGSAVITVRPLTRLSIKELQAAQGTETINMNLQAGRVRVEVNPPAGSKASLEIASPAAVASVRGTSFDFDNRNLSVDKGIVIFIGKWGYELTVQEGRKAVVGASGTASWAQPGVVYDNTAAPTGGTVVKKSGGSDDSDDSTVSGGGGSKPKPQEPSGPKQPSQWNDDRR